MKVSLMTAWRLVESEPVLVTQWLRIHRNTYETPQGRVPDYYVLSRDGFVLIVAKSDVSILFVRQYRPATDRSHPCPS